MIDFDKSINIKINKFQKELMSPNRTKIALVVIDGHTLGCIRPNSLSAEVLHASVLKGAVGTTEPIFFLGRDIRLASEQDFEEFRVHFDGFNNRDAYLFN